MVTFPCIAKEYMYYWKFLNYWKNKILKQHRDDHISCIYGIEVILRSESALREDALTQTHNLHPKVQTLVTRFSKSKENWNVLFWANPTQTAPGLMVKLNSGPSCGEATVLTTAPLCHIFYELLSNIHNFCFFNYNTYRQGARQTVWLCKITPPAN